ncbi:MAG TPA: polysaccharide deacetylase [Candidatus Limnocylindrales bacterium]|jgi:peptidoglycan/xylan/chitin deacetylase (PgdA/CDA1 family)
MTTDADQPRLTVALTFDHDSLSDGIRRGDPPIKMSHAEFGHRVGVPRILELLEREGIKSSWFIPGATLELYPSDTEAILAGGHEVGCHGWFHEDYSVLDAAEQRAIQDRSIDAVERFTGQRPRGHRAPYWAFSDDTIGVLEDAGFAYDSSLMADDYRPYRVRRGDRHSPSDGSTFGPESSLIEVPVYWTLDDWPLFEPGPDNGRDGMSAPSKVLEIWKAELRYAWEHAPGGLLTITMHPECIGRGHRMAMVEQFIAEAKALEGVVFDRLDGYLARLRLVDVAG